MNTGKALQTERLLLLPGLNARDNKSFLRMLREDGDFYMFCGVKYSRWRLRRFANYFERTGHGECVYSLFLKDEPERFIGYVGFHREDHYEMEFYVSKPYRNRGYFTEASRAVIGHLFGEGLSVDGNTLTVDSLFSTTVEDNAPTVRVLKKLGFRRNIPKDGPILVMIGHVTKTGKIIDTWVEEYILERPARQRDGSVQPQTDNPSCRAFAGKGQTALEQTCE